MDFMNIGIEQLNVSGFDPSFAMDSLSRMRPQGEKDFSALIKKSLSDDPESIINGARQTPIDKNDQLYQLCLELETFLIKNLLNSMRSTVSKSGLIEQGFAGKMYEDMLYDEYAKDLTRNANFGLAEQAYRQLSQTYSKGSYV